MNNGEQNKRELFDLNEQAHRFDDVDNEQGSHHHTIGTGINQAASGKDLADLTERLAAVNTAEYTITQTVNPFDLFGQFRFLELLAVGAGGGSGGAIGNAGELAAGGGGGGGGTAIKRLLWADIEDVDLVITVGAGGTAGASTGTNGGDGNLTKAEVSGLVIVSAAGGGGGGGDATSLASGSFGVGGAGGIGGLGTVGDLLFQGGDGGNGFIIGSGTLMGRWGGTSYLVGQQRPTATDQAGLTGRAGGGGAVGAASNTATDRAGAVGGAGRLTLVAYG